MNTNTKVPDGKGAVYKIINKVNGKVYVGQTVRGVKNRFNEHARQPNSYIGRSIRKYGKGNFELKIIDTSYNIDELNEKEVYWIKQLDTQKPKGYNLIGGGGNVVGLRHSLESRIKMSEVQKSLANQVGHKNHYYGKKHSDETRRKMRELRKAKRVKNIDTGEVYRSCADAGRKTGLNRIMIARVARGEAKTTLGTRWKYIDKEPIMQEY